MDEYIKHESSKPMPYIFRNINWIICPRELIHLLFREYDVELDEEPII